MRVSAKARRVRLVMKPEGLEVVLPRGQSRRRIPELLERHRDWIEEASRRIDEHRRRSSEEAPRLPDEVALPCTGEVWPVEYRRSSGAASRTRVDAKAGRLLVFGDPGDYEGCKRALCRWLSRKAREELIPVLAELAEQHGFQYMRVTIRQQRTRWGSCSRRGSISLNAKLLLLPRDACEYVLLHELCHTRVMDHSPRFWALLGECDPEYRVHKKLVRESAKTIPSWLDREFDAEVV